MSFEDSEYTSANIVPVIDFPENLRTSDRVQRLLNGYEKRYRSLPLFVVRVPGRVNLIGEHIDYCGYSVLPMAIKQDIMIAVGPSDSSSLINLANIDSQYPEVSIEQTDLEFPKSIKWYHYFLCGYKGVLDKYCADECCPPINILIHGTIPAGSGLSSSSALVCASALSTLILYYHSLCKLY